MKKPPTSTDIPDQAAREVAPAKEPVNRTQEKMKKLLSVQLDKITIRYQGADHDYPRCKGAVVISADEIGAMSEGLALVLIFLAGARKLYLARDTFLAINDGIWFHIDRDLGGLTPEAKELFGDDEDVLAAAALNRDAHAKKSKTK